MGRRDDAVRVDELLGPPYTAETIDFDEDEQGPVVTTLVQLDRAVKSRPYEESLL